MNSFVKILLMIVVLTLAFPPLLVTSFILLWSSFVPPEYLLGGAFFEFIGGVASGYVGIKLLLFLREITKQIQQLS